MQQLSRIESLDYGPDADYESAVRENSQVLRGVLEGTKVVAAPTLADDLAIIVGPGRVLIVLLGWHLLLALAFAAGLMLS